MTRLSPRRNRGTATAELAIILPVILLLALGALEFGQIFQAWVVVTAAAREGARQAAMGASAATVQTQVVLPYLQASGLSTDPSVHLPTVAEIVVAPATGQPGDMVSVYVPLWVEVSTPMIRSLLPANPMRIGAQTTTRRQ